MKTSKKNMEPNINFICITKEESSGLILEGRENMFMSVMKIYWLVLKLTICLILASIIKKNS